MSDKAQTYNIETKNNDLFPGVLFTFTVNSSLLDLTGWSARMQVRKTWDSAAVISIETGSGLTIVDPPTNGQLSIDEQVFSLDTPGLYKYDLELIDTDGAPHTYIKGTLTVYEDISHD